MKIIFLMSLIVSSNAFSMPCNNRGNKLVTAAADGDFSQVEKILRYSADVNCLNENGYTALMAASSGGHTEVIKLLLSAGAQLEVKSPLVVRRNGNITITRSAGTTALMDAYKNSDLSTLTKTVSLLVDAGANVNHRTERAIPVYRGDKSVLEIAISAAIFRMGQVAPVNQLLKAGAKVNDLNYAAKNALSTLMDYDPKWDEGLILELMHSLIEAGANVNQQELELERGVFLDTPLMDVAWDENRNGRLEILLAAGAKVNLSDFTGLTAFMRAAWGGNIAGLKLLQNAGANLNDVKRACSEAHNRMETETVRFLKTLGATTLDCYE